MGKLFSELKRRKVFKVAAVYAVVAWLLVQIVTSILPTFEAPQWVSQSIILLLVLGFPITVIMAWAFEVTPDGIKTDSASHSKQTVAAPTDQKLTYAMLGLLVLIGGFQVADRFLFDSEPRQIAAPVASSNAQVRRSILPLGPMALSSGGDHASRTTLSLSPDGSRLAYSAHSNGKTQLYIRDLNQLEPRPLGAPFGANFPTSIAFSPDGETLAFYDSTDLMKVTIEGGATQRIATDVAGGGNGVAAGLDWAADNTIVATSLGLKLWRISATSGSSQALDIPIVDNFGAEFHGEPQVLPGGDAMLFTRRRRGTGGSSSNIELAGADRRESGLLIQNSCARVRFGEFLLI
jgi:hypothetical protein